MIFSPWKIELAMQDDDVEFFQEFYRSGEWFRLGFEGEPIMLYRAAEHGARGICLFLLENGADVNAGYNGFTALCGAVAGGDLDMVRDLLRSGARVDGNADTICPPLLTAFQHHNEEAAHCLIEAGADCNRCHLWSEESPLDMARRFGCFQTEKLLLARGARSTYELPDCPKGPERDFLRYVLNRTERILLREETRQTQAGPITLRSARTLGGKKKLVFTWGVSRCSGSRLELYTEVPPEWSFDAPEPKNRLITECLFCCARMLAAGKSLEKGDFLSAGSKECKGLPWPSHQMGMRVSAPRCFADSEKLAGIQFLEVSPVYVQYSGERRKTKSIAYGGSDEG